MQTGISISYGKSVLVLLYLIQYMVLLRNYATLNINCLQSKNKQSLLNAFIRQNSIDILLLQEVNTENFDFIGPQYDYVVNTGDENRGTAVIYRCGLTVDAIEKHPSGRVIAMKINNIQSPLFCISTSATETDTLLKHVNRHLNLQQQHDLQLPITEEEILRAIETAPKNSAPGPDGLTYQLYKMQWNLIKDTLVDLFNYIFDRGIVVEGFSDGIVILLPKVTNPRTVSEYRPITLLNTDYKLFMKILACRVKTTFRDIIEIGQTCSVPDKSIIHNLATIRDSILYYEEFPDEKAALLSIDFNKGLIE
ncbi:hypothetical protein ANN_12927 [Periplaneta americana]|uniref:Endonuclease/exonuclease/phosphatase domain-containing protein n=1 Tax=Periplaneta americana TaxID=6978 RepID=A0ABQ8THY1_PERAM|nr:hypothetical protein ANN_12927 [Periplaneta americana]